MRLMLPALALTGCSHMLANPFDGAPYKDLEWTDSYEQALEDGLEQDKPVYLVLAAGPITGFT